MKRRYTGLGTRENRNTVPRYVKKELIIEFEAAYSKRPVANINHLDPAPVFRPQNARSDFTLYHLTFTVIDCSF